MYRFEIVQEWNGDYVWRLVERHGHVVATSDDRYKTAQIAASAVRGLVPQLAHAAIDDRSLVA